MSSLFPLLALLSSSPLLTLAQQIGTNTPEVHPQLPSQKCTLSSGCTTVNTALVLDSQYRWLHSKDGYTSCQSGSGWDPTLCPDGVSCAENCAVEGVDYSGYGIAVEGDAVTMRLFLRNEDNSTKLASPRAYLLADENTYDMFKLLNQEITYDVDVSQVPCGINGALYLSEMLADGGYNNDTNPAGAKYGTGYCDAQCPRTPFVVNDGTYEVSLAAWCAQCRVLIVNQANLDQYGNCCSEMDLWEANNAATQLTPHPCDYNTSAPYLCTGDACGDAGVCDKPGCEYNPYRQGHPDFYGPGKTIDTNTKFTVVTQFLTNDGTANGTLSEIRRLYVQNGTTFANPKSEVEGLAPYDSLSDQYCQEQKTVFNGLPNTFAMEGGMAQFSRAIANGMVLVFSIVSLSTPSP